MHHAIRRLPVEGWAPAAVALTVVAFALGSSPVAWIRETGGPLRWVALFALLALAALSAARVRARPPAAAAAAATGFVGLALLSSLWSVDPSLTFARGVSLAVLLLTALLLAASVPAESVLRGVLAGALLVALAGLAVLLLDRPSALQEATTGVPTRYQGLGENPNTAALLFAVSLPLAAWQVVAGRRWIGVAAFLLLAGSIAAAGSRGALAAGFAASVLVLLLAAPLRRGLALAAAAVAFLALAVAAGEIPDPVPTTAPSSSEEPARPRYQDAEAVFPLVSDVGRSLPGGGGLERPRRLLGSSGRLDAWEGAARQAAERPLLGHGFGTEGDVFVDRYFFFAGGLPESSYLGLALQLGLLGLAAFAALVATLVAGARRGFRTPAAAACLGVVVAGLVAASVQSYVTSVGNVATVSFWLAAFLLRARPA